ncbi:MAG TPA: FUSC family protein [Propionibacteriaceae bacterium]|nr:FUSC family protein [Propionibacteriaceae bacterium]
MKSAPSLQEIKLRAFDVSERTAELGRTSLRLRVRRLRSRSFFIIQCAVSAGLAWWLASVVLQHSMPFFAPVAAIICLGFTFGQRLRRGIEVAIGVAVGVFVGDLFVTFFGSGAWQIVVVILLAMSIAALLGAGQLLIIQSGVQSAIIIGLAATPSEGLSRWLDAVVGCAVALLAATFVPLAPLRKPRVLAAQVLSDFAATLEAAEAALGNRDSEAADAVLDQARASETNLSALNEAAAEGMAVVRYSPFRRRHLPAVQAYSELHGPLERAHRNLRVLARRSAVSIWRHEEVPDSYRELMKSLADAIRFMAAELTDRRMPVAARQRLIGLGEASSHAKLIESISAVVILAQLRSMLTDLMQLTGMDYEEAREVIPDMD